ncbi:DNA circularization family protein [Burkholderia sp. MSHR3999]|uniref:DNA circularization protein n=1 Tax=Burkholderia sp. MSHR3999 TaxID=1542965 RepID=UPI0005AC51EA|nr:DNA circularization N-terminal domain-containing protein [Burkholderia sp. MSHR3999]KIP19322.1 DNA circularization family protein [Burkholderia sp. MSHR3999]
MSWKDLLQDASFRGVTFDCVRTRDAAKRGLAKHEYPYLDGADVEDLGRGPRDTHLTAVFWGDDYEASLKAFIDVLDKSGYGELVHPVFGSIPKAQVEDYAISHDAENPDYCTVEIAFVEATPGNPFFVQQLPEQKAEAVSALTDTARSIASTAFAATIDALKLVQSNMPRLNLFRDLMTGTLGALGSLVPSVVASTLDLIEYPLAFASDVLSYLSGLSDQHTFGVGAIVSDWKSFSEQMTNAVALPAGISTGDATVSSSAGLIQAGVVALTNSAALYGDASVTADGSTVSLGVNANADDVAVAQAFMQLAAAAQLADTASSILADEAADATLAPTEIELIVDTTRSAIQAAIDMHRQLYPLDTYRPIAEGLKDIALAIQTAAIAVIDERPPLIARTVTVFGNLHLTAFRWYGDYTRSAELARLNPQVTNPNFLMPGDVLNAYSK